MLAWLAEHSGLTSGLVGILGHVGTEAVGFLRDKAKFANVKELEELKDKLQVRLQSYQKTDKIHGLIIAGLLVATVISYFVGSESLQDTLTSWTGIAIFWLFGRVATRSLSIGTK